MSTAFYWEYKKLLRFIWQKIKIFTLWAFKPIVVFVTMQVIAIVLTVMWVMWFNEKKSELALAASKFGDQLFDSRYGWAFLVVGCVLLTFVFMGTITQFVISMRLKSLMNQQQSFVSSVTHELRSPLASLRLALDTLRVRALDAKTKDSIYEMASKDTERLTRLVDRILLAARLDRGIAFTGGDEASAFGLKELITEIVDKMVFVDPSLKSRIEIQCSEGFVLTIPKETVELILSNLIENAVKYSPDGEKIRIEVLEKEESNQLIVSVKDQGIGLAKREKQRIFRMFHRSEAVQEKAIPGMGVGLFIVKKAVKSFEGSVWAESLGRGKGSTFHVALPIKYVLDSEL